MSELKKPGDHPEFFRLPAPAGRSRESSIVLDAQGQFWHDGERIVHGGMSRAFHSWIARHPDNGRPILQNGYDWCYFQVEDAAYQVQTLSTSPPPTRVTLSDESEEPLNASTLRLGKNGRLYVRVKGGNFEASFSPQAQAALGELLEQAPDDSFWLCLPEGRFPIAEAEALKNPR